MPKLPLDPARLRELRALRGPALRALRHPRRSVTQAVNGAVSVVGTLLSRRPAEEPIPGAVSETPEPPPTDLAMGPDEVASTPAPASATSPADTTAAAPPTSAPPEPAGATAEAGTPETAVDTDAAAEDDEPPEEHLGGPAPHIPPHIAKDVERDFDEDIPGITPGRRR